MRDVSAVRALVACGLFAIGSACAETPRAPAADGREPVVVERVFDGDTIAVRRAGRSERVRLIGVDSPEAHDSPKLDRQLARGGDRARILALGARATAFTRTRLLGRTVELERDVETHDRYGRTLAYVWLPDGTLFNATLVEAGWARLLTIPPNVRYVDRFIPLEHAARGARRGLWSAAGTGASP